MTSPVAVIGNSSLNIGFGVAADLSLAGHEVRPTSTYVRRSTLEDVFLILTGRTLED